MSRDPRPRPSRSAKRQALPAPSHAGRIWLLAFVLLIGLITIAIFGRLLLEQRLALGATPTITRIAANLETPTLDFRATHNFADLATQLAYNDALTGIATRTPVATRTPTATETPTETSTPYISSLPSVTGPVNDTPTPEPTATPTIDTETLTPLPAAVTQTAVAGETAIALLFTPTATSTPVPTATPTQTIVATLPVATAQARTRTTVVDVYAGPSVLYSLIGQLPQGSVVRLEGRTVSGEWVHLCCVNSKDGWARQAYFSFTDNKAPVSTPTDAEDDEARWLAVQQSNASPLTPLPTQTAIPDSDFPLLRRDAAGSGRVNIDFRTPIQPVTKSPGIAGGGFSSPPLIVGSHVIIASFDLELYNFNKETGTQRWRFRFATRIQNAPAIQNPYIYVIDDAGRLTALKGSEDDKSAADSPAAAISWERQPFPPNVVPNAGINIRGDTLFVPASNHRLYALDLQKKGEERWTFSIDPPGPGMQYPVIGDQLIYVGDARLSALDVYSGTLVWQDSIIAGVAGPPVYAGPFGDARADVYRLAELYAADTNGTIHALDANTGARFWEQKTGFRPTSLAVDDTRLYAAGPGIVLALGRRTGNLLWQTQISGDGILGGPIVGNGRLLVVDSTGRAQILDAATGGFTQATPINETLIGPPAVSEGWIYFATNPNRLKAVKEGN